MTDHAERIRNWEHLWARYMEAAASYSTTKCAFDTRGGRTRANRNALKTGHMRLARAYKTLVTWCCANNEAVPAGCDPYEVMRAS